MQEPEPAHVLDWMEVEFFEIQRDGYSGMAGSVERLNRASMDYILTEHGITEPGRRRLLRSIWYRMHADLMRLQSEQREAARKKG